MGYWPLINSVVKNSDMILLVVDARMPEISKNTEIIRKVEVSKKRIILVFNKSDLVSNKEIANLKRKHPNAHFVSSTKKTGIKNLKEFLENKADNHNKSSMRIGILGYPNVGKSALLNCLAPSAQAQVSNKSGTTKKIQWIRSKNIRFMDSPGVIPQTDSATKVGITASKDPHRLKDPEKVAYKIITHLNKKNKKILQTFYNIRSGTAEETFRAIAHKKKYLLKGGKIDEHRTAIKIIEDWQKGKIQLR